MYIGEKLTLNPRSFHHRIREGSGHYIDTQQFMGIDPFDKSKFHQLYEPPVNVCEKGDTLLLELLVPGFRKDEITIRVDQNELVVTGLKSASDQATNKNYVYREKVVRQFERRFDLGGTADPDKIEAEMDLGVLHLKLYPGPAKKKH